MFIELYDLAKPAEMIDDPFENSELGRMDFRSIFLEISVLRRNINRTNNDLRGEFHSLMGTNAHDSATHNSDLVEKVLFTI